METDFRSKCELIAAFRSDVIRLQSTRGSGSGIAGYDEMASICGTSLLLMSECLIDACYLAVSRLIKDRPMPAKRD